MNRLLLASIALFALTACGTVPEEAHPADAGGMTERDASFIPVDAGFFGVDAGGEPAFVLECAERSPEGTESVASACAGLAGALDSATELCGVPVECPYLEGAIVNKTDRTACWWFLNEATSCADVTAVLAECSRCAE